MGFFSNQLAAVIEWGQQAPGTLLYQFPSAGNEIKHASKLLVGPGQGVLLVYEGRVADVFDQEGLYVLTTDNHPFFTTLTKLRTGFESEHKLRIYFYRRAEVVNQGWGTALPIKYLDPVYQFPVELGANGSFSFRLADARFFFTEVAGFKNSYTTQEAKTLLQSRIAQTLTTHLAGAGLSYQQLDARLGELAEGLRAPLAAEFSRLGFELTDFRLNGTVFDEDTQQRIRRIADVSADSQAAAGGGLSYAELEKIKALRDAARNESGLAGAGLQLGAGAELGKLFAAQQAAPAETAAPAPAPAAPDPVQQLQKLKLLLTEGIITQTEFDAKKQVWLDQL